MTAVECLAELTCEADHHFICTIHDFRYCVIALHQGGELREMFTSQVCVDRSCLTERVQFTGGETVRRKHV